jgi:hypothetical protein
MTAGEAFATIIEDAGGPFFAAVPRGCLTIRFQSAGDVSLALTPDA